MAPIGPSRLVRRESCTCRSGVGRLWIRRTNEFIKNIMEFDDGLGLFYLWGFSGYIYIRLAVRI